MGKFRTIGHIFWHYIHKCSEVLFCFSSAIKGDANGTRNPVIPVPALSEDDFLIYQILL